MWLSYMLVLSGMLATIESKNGKYRMNCEPKWNPINNDLKISKAFNTWGRVIKDNIDRPTFQCKMLKKIRKVYNTILQARRNCYADVKKTKSRQKKIADHEKKKARRLALAAEKAEERQEKKDARALKRELKAAEKEQQESSRKRRDDEDSFVLTAEDAEDSSVDASELTDIENEEFTDETFDDSISDICNEDSVDSYDQETCATVRSLEDKNRKEIVYKIGNGGKAMKKWIDIYFPKDNELPKGSGCKKQEMIKRVKKHTKRIIAKRTEYPTSKTKNKKQDEKEKREEEKDE